MKPFISAEAVGLIPFALIMVGLWLAPFTLTTKAFFVAGFWLAWTLGVLLVL